jgi:NADH:ubiquinone oxidoreductase subunit
MGPAILLSYPLNVVVDGDEMAKKNSKRREWTKTDIRELKTLARAKTPAGKIARSLKRTEGATRQKAFALGVSLDTRG